MKYKNRFCQDEKPQEPIERFDIGCHARPPARLPKEVSAGTPRFDVDSRRAVFIDDHAPHIAGARREGFHAVQFFSPQQLREELVALGLPVQQGQSAR
ncbi:hypothetical protein PSH97_09810 [Pseudomonas cucumis]|uniref:Uncharacterized protein n=1 Tax=Pseudomonas cucumis TaxID=2954082 RepID=A0ABY9F1J4_9PSED|nr:hypothetical protein [Pseudomonas cucumis]WLG86791.1 hypothetical protein PSH97_09810 [Pseudomonas cucumis]